HSFGEGRSLHLNGCKEVEPVGQFSHTDSVEYEIGPQYSIRFVEVEKGDRCLSAGAHKACRKPLNIAVARVPQRGPQRARPVSTECGAAAGRTSAASEDASENRVTDTGACTRAWIVVSVFTRPSGVGELGSGLVGLGRFICDNASYVCGVPGVPGDFQVVRQQTSADWVCLLQTPGHTLIEGKASRRTTLTLWRPTGPAGLALERACGRREWRTCLARP